jgi:hypothetical protein
MPTQYVRIAGMTMQEDLEPRSVSFNAVGQSGSGISDRVWHPVVAAARFAVSAVVGGTEGDRSGFPIGIGGGDVLGGSVVGGEGDGAAVSREVRAGTNLGLAKGEAIWLII